MPAGFQVYNTAGTVSVDDSSPALHFKGKYTVTIPPGPAPIRYVQIDISNCTQYAQFAIRPRVDNRWINVVNLGVPSGQPAHVRRISVGLYSGFYDLPLPNDSFLVDVYHYDLPSQAIGSGFGIQLFDSTGMCTFNSNERPCIVYANLMQMPPNPTDDWLSEFPMNMPQQMGYTMPSGKVGAALFHLGYTRTVRIPESGITYNFNLVTIMSTSGNTVQIWPDNLWLHSSNSGTSSYFNRWTGTNGGLVVDVTAL